MGKAMFWNELNVLYIKDLDVVDKDWSHHKEQQPQVKLQHATESCLMSCDEVHHINACCSIWTYGLCYTRFWKNIAELYVQMKTTHPSKEA